MMFWFLFFIFSKAESTISGGDASVESGAKPVCLNQPENIKKIKDHVKTLTSEKIKKNPELKKTKYNVHKEFLKNETDEQKLARLIYSETLAAHCSEQNETLVGPIGDTILNRVRLRGQNVESVIFEYNQFASSLNTYGDSSLSDFLCPQNEKLWKMAVLKASELKQRQKASSFPEDGVNYYLFKHFTAEKKVVPPDWTKSLKVIEGSSTACVKFYKNPDWK